MAPRPRPPGIRDGDAGKTYKLVHYDHGSGVCAADVNNDGRPDLYFGTQLGTNELWKNLGNVRFSNITKSAGLELSDAIAVGCSFADIDNDGDPRSIHYDGAPRQSSL